jgi:hypothetical protein
VYLDVVVRAREEPQQPPHGKASRASFAQGREVLLPKSDHRGAQRLVVALEQNAKLLHQELLELPFDHVAAAEHADNKVALVVRTAFNEREPVRKTAERVAGCFFEYLQ